MLEISTNEPSTKHLLLFHSDNFQPQLQILDKDETDIERHLFFESISAK